MNSPSSTDQHTSPLDLTTFVNEHGRLPRLEDNPRPWCYRGWLLSYVIQLHAIIPAVADRWGYHLRTLEAGKLLDEPIPQIAFTSPDRKVYALLQHWARLIDHDGGGWSDFRSLMDWLCWGLSLSQEEPSLKDSVNEQLYRQVDLSPPGHWRKSRKTKANIRQWKTGKSAGK